MNQREGRKRERDGERMWGRISRNIVVSAVASGRPWALSSSHNQGLPRASLSFPSSTSWFLSYGADNVAKHVILGLPLKHYLCGRCDMSECLATRTCQLHYLSQCFFMGTCYIFIFLNYRELCKIVFFFFFCNCISIAYFFCLPAHM